MEYLSIDLSKMINALLLFCLFCFKMEFSVSFISRGHCFLSLNEVLTYSFCFKLFEFSNDGSASFA